MACFLVPVAEAIVTTIVEKALKSTEKKAVVKLNSADGTALEVSKTPFSAKLGWLNKLLWGGSALLAFEHVWHGEIVPFFPFLTAVKSGETGEMLAEMGITITDLEMRMLIEAALAEFNRAFEKEGADGIEDTADDAGGSK